MSALWKVISAIFVVCMTLMEIVPGSCRGTWDYMCGPKCLLVVCQKLGVTTTLDELITMTGASDQKGTSLSDLISAAKAKGLSAAGFKIGLEELLATGAPAIAHLWDDHYVVVEAEDGERLRVTDPPNEPYSVTVKSFKNHYSGFAMIIARSPASFPVQTSNGADLRFREYVHDFGFVDEGDTVTSKVTYRNAGSAELVISNVSGSCNSVLAVPSQYYLPPGEEAELNIFLDTKAVRGSAHFTILVSSNDPVTPIAKLQLVGGVRSRRVVCSPSQLTFGKLGIGQGSTRDISIPDSSEKTANYSDVELKVRRVYSNNPHVKVQVVGEPDAVRHAYLLRVSVEPSAPIGDLSAMVMVETTHPKEPVLSIPVVATMVGRIHVSPAEQVFFPPSKKGAKCSKSVTISTVGSQPLELEGVKIPVDYISATLARKTETEGYLLTVALLPNAPAGCIRQELVIRTNDPDQPQIRVPLYALVEDQQAITREQHSGESD